MIRFSPYKVVDLILVISGLAEVELGPSTLGSPEVALIRGLIQ